MFEKDGDVTSSPKPAKRGLGIMRRIRSAFHHKDKLSSTVMRLAVCSQKTLQKSSNSSLQAPEFARSVSASVGHKMPVPEAPFGRSISVSVSREQYVKATAPLDSVRSPLHTSSNSISNSIRSPCPIHCIELLAEINRKPRGHCVPLPLRGAVGVRICRAIMWTAGGWRAWHPCPSQGWRGSAAV